MIRTVENELIKRGYLKLARKVSTLFKNLFIRITGHPEEDLKRGYSYSMDEFGEESQVHEGLSGYELLDERDVKKLDDRMGVYGTFKDRSGKPAKMYFCIFSGRSVGIGPDGEDLFKPNKIVFKKDTRKFKSLNNVINELRLKNFII